MKHNADTLASYLLNQVNVNNQQEFETFQKNVLAPAIVKIITHGDDVTFKGIGETPLESEIERLVVNHKIEQLYVMVKTIFQLDAQYNKNISFEDKTFQFDCKRNGKCNLEILNNPLANGVDGYFDLSIVAHKMVNGWVRILIEPKKHFVKTKNGDVCGGVLSLTYSNAYIGDCDFRVAFDIADETGKNINVTNDCEIMNDDIFHFNSVIEWVSSVMNNKFNIFTDKQNN